MKKENKKRNATSKYNLMFIACAAIGIICGVLYVRSIRLGDLNDSNTVIVKEKDLQKLLNDFSDEYKCTKASEEELNQFIKNKLGLIK